MHEFSIAEDILDIVQENAGPGAQVDCVHLILGPLSGVSPDALLFCFPEVAKPLGMGTPRLVIEETAAKVHCCDCGLDYESKEFYDGCPRCDSMNRQILSGQELTVDWIELVED